MCLRPPAGVHASQVQSGSVTVMSGALRNVHAFRKIRRSVALPRYACSASFLLSDVISVVDTSWANLSIRATLHPQRLPSPTLTVPLALTLPLASEYEQTTALSYCRADQKLGSASGFCRICTAACQRVCRCTASVTAAAAVSVCRRCALTCTIASAKCIGHQGSIIEYPAS